jgi:predicted lipid-binding transport protein (Tim44 family)
MRASGWPARRARYHVLIRGATAGTDWRRQRAYIEVATELVESPLVPQVVELVILAAVAAVVLFQLYAVLGRRVGRQAEDLAPAQTGGAAREPAQPAIAGVTEPAALTGLAALKARDPSFDIARFMQGARQAFQMVVKAFAAGDRNTLKPLLAPEVMSSFETAMAQREGEGRSEQVEFLQEPRADLESLGVIGDLAKASVRFLAEFRSRSKGPEGEAVDDRRTAEVWTFQRNLTSRDPNWTLVHVDPAEA